MAYRTSHDPIWSHPDRKKLFLLVVFVVGALTAVSVFLLLKSLNYEQTPQMPLVRPTVYLTLPQKDDAQSPSLS